MQAPEIKEAKIVAPHPKPILPLKISLEEYVSPEQTRSDQDIVGYQLSMIRRARRLVDRFVSLPQSCHFDDFHWRPQSNLAKFKSRGLAIAQRFDSYYY